MRQDPKENPVTGLLNIQKFIFLLDDFHFSEFEKYLQSINATLPRKLALAIRTHLPAFHQPNELYKIVYGTKEVDVRAKFNQMASHTFRLSRYLALNYPGYLLHNQTRLEKLANGGLYNESLALAEMMYDIAERTDNFDSLCHAILFLKGAAYINDNMGAYKKYLSELESVTQTKALYYKLYAAADGIILELEKSVSPEQLNEQRRFFSAYHNHPSAAIRIVSLYGYLVHVFYHDPAIFSNPADSPKLDELEKELRNNSQVVLPYMVDPVGEVSFMKFTAQIHKLSSTEILKGLEEHTEHFKLTKFRNLDFKTGQQIILNVHAANLFHICMPLCYRAEFPDNLPEPYLVR